MVRLSDKSKLYWSKKTNSSPKNRKKIFPNLLKYLNTSLNEIKDSGFIDKFYRQLQTKGCLISDEELITSSGFLVTKEYWSNITISDIETIFSKINLQG